MSDVDKDPSSADPAPKDPDPASKGPNDPVGANASQGGHGDGNISGFTLRESYRGESGGSSYGFPELRGLKNGGFSADSDLQKMKDMAEGAFQVTTGEEPTLSGAYHFVTGSPSATDLGIGGIVTLGAFLLAGRAGGAVAGEGAELVLGTDPLAGIGALVQQLKTALGLGSIAKEAAGLYGNIKTRVEGLVRFNDAARTLLKSNAPDDHTPGEARAKQNKVEP